MPIFSAVGGRESIFLIGWGKPENPANGGRGRPHAAPMGENPAIEELMHLVRIRV